MTHSSFEASDVVKWEQRGSLTRRRPALGRRRVLRSSRPRGLGPTGSRRKRLPAGLRPAFHVPSRPSSGKKADCTPPDAATWSASWVDHNDPYAAEGRGFQAEEAAEWRSQGFSVDGARDWRSTYLEPDAAARLLAAGFEASDVVKWKQCGVSPDDAPRCWVAVGFSDPQTAGSWPYWFSPEETSRWVGAGFSDPIDAEGWKDNGFTPTAAAAWSAHRLRRSGDAKTAARRAFKAEEAARWRSQGFSIDAAKEWASACHEPDAATRLLAVGFKPSDVEGIDSDTVEWTYDSAVAAGATCEEARTWVKARVEDSAIQSWRSGGLHCGRSRRLGPLGIRY